MEDPPAFSPDLVAPCGMDCAICAQHLAQVYDLKTQGIPMAYCPGCRARNKNCAFVKRHCKPLRAGQRDSCVECPDLPCPPLAKLDNHYRIRFHISMIDNLRFIQQHGLQRFLEAEAARWRCPACGGLISGYNGLCFQCQTDHLRQRSRWYYKNPKGNTWKS